jgi:hypothetical protein
MNKIVLADYARALANAYGEEWLPNEDDQHFVLYHALDEALGEYYERTRCSIVNFSKTVTPGTHTYTISGLGTGASRLLTIEYMAYDDYPIEVRTREELTKEDPNWRHVTSQSAPEYYIPMGAGQFRLYPTPNEAKTLYVEGPEYPDTTLWTEDIDPPLVHLRAQPLLAMWAAILCTVRDISNPSMLRASSIFPRYELGMNKESNRVAGRSKWEV